MFWMANGEQPPGLVRAVVPVFIFVQNTDPLLVRAIDVYRNALQSRRRRCEHEPTPFVLDEIQEIIFAIDFELQFFFSL